MGATSNTINLLSNIFSTSPVGIVVCNAVNHKIVMVNPKTLEILGYNNQLQLIDKCISTIITTEISTVTNLSLKKLFSSQQDTEIKLFKTDETPIWIQLSVSNMTHESSELTILQLLDITKQKTLKETLKLRNAEYKKLFDHSINGIAIYDMQAEQYIECNAKFSEIYGYEKDELRKLSSLDLTWNYAPNDKEYYKQKYIENYEKLCQGEVLKFESTHKIKKGNKIYVNMTLIPFEIGKELYVKQVTEDLTLQYLSSMKLNETLTELNQVNTKLHETNKLLENYAFLISHDLKEPVRTIVGLSQILRRNMANNNLKTQDEFLELIEKAGKHLNTMINDIFSFYKLNEQNKTFEQTDTVLIIEKTILHLQALTKNTNVKITVPEKMPQNIIAQPTLLYQVFQNIIKNAIKFMKTDTPGEITIGYTALQDYHQFAIKDNGIGIAKESQEKIFQLFQKGHNSKAHKGTGIGLAVCEKIISFHEGNIWVESTLGAGTTFYFTINKNLEITKA